MEPKGLGARDLKECLSVQIEEDKESHAYIILSKYFDDFMHKSMKKLKPNLNVPVKNFMMLLK